MRLADIIHHDRIKTQEILVPGDEKGGDRMKEIREEEMKRKDKRHGQNEREWRRRRERKRGRLRGERSSLTKQDEPVTKQQ